MAAAQTKGHEDKHTGMQERKKKRKKSKQKKSRKQGTREASKKIVLKASP